jgi:hypothetical protein
MNSSDIERTAHELHLEIFERRAELFPGWVPSPLRMCQPEAAAEILQLTYFESDTLGRFGMAGDRFEPAGAMDRDQRLIAVSTKVSRPVQRFTGAHEIGHFLLHRGAMMFRDRPVFELTGPRSRTEREADYFAACFLAPEKILKTEFKYRFGSKEPLPLNTTVAYHLARGSADELLNAPTGTLNFAMAVASARSFGSHQFTPLHEFFGISASAMAIRLKELQLVVD